MGSDAPIVLGKVRVQKEATAVACFVGVRAWAPEALGVFVVVGGWTGKEEGRGR